MVSHFSDCGVNNMQTVILEKVRSFDPFIRKAREQFYIDLLETKINEVFPYFGVFKVSVVKKVA